MGLTARWLGQVEDKTALFQSCALVLLMEDVTALGQLKIVCSL